MSELQVASALAEADVFSIEELFDRDPLALTTHDRSAIVAELRKRRVDWEQAEKVKQPRAKASAKSSPDAEAIKSLTLDDLLGVS